jgi:hypothetical protein
LDAQAALDAQETSTRGIRRSDSDKKREAELSKKAKEAMGAYEAEKSATGNTKQYGMKKGGAVKKMADGGTTDKSFPRRMYEKVMGTPEQNAEAQKRMDEQDKKNPDSIPAKINKVVKTVTGKKNGGMTASRRGDGCAQRGKTKGRMV